MPDLLVLLNQCRDRWFLHLREDGTDDRLLLEMRHYVDGVLEMAKPAPLTPPGPGKT